MFTNKQSKQPKPESLQPGGARTGSTGYMAELDQWLDETVFVPIEQAIAAQDSKELYVAFDEAKQQLKHRVLASYHNGLKAKSAINRKSYDKQSYRRN